MSSARLGAVLALMMAAACNGLPPQESPQEHPGDTDEPPWQPPDETPTFPLDTGFDGIQDATPDNWLHARHVGTLTLSGSPYDTLVGELLIEESVSADPTHPGPLEDDEEGDDTDDPEDEADLPHCEVRYTLSGAPPDETTGCPCDFVFDVEFSVVKGTPGPCGIPEVPTGGEVRRMGYSSADQTIFVNYKGSGVYLPWYPATQTGDTVEFEWTASVGFVVEEM